MAMAAAASDKDSIASGATLVDGTPLTPQQLGIQIKKSCKKNYAWILMCFFLGLMGMEALETAVGYWEDALAAYHPKGAAAAMGNAAGALTTAEETKFIHMLESILEGAFQLQVCFIFFYLLSWLAKLNKSLPESYAS